MFKFTIHSGDALILYLVSLFGAYSLTIWKPNMPFLAFATQLTTAFIAFITRRYFKDKLGCANGTQSPEVKSELTTIENVGK